MKRINPWFVMAGLFLLVVLMNLNTLRGELLTWDDALLVTENPRVQVAGFAGLLRVLSPSDGLAGRHLEYLPLRDLAYALIFYFRGLDPFTFHLVNVLAHAVACALLFWCARSWIGDAAALIAAFLFAAHPVHVEAVAWISGLKDPTFTACTLLCAGLYFRSQGGTRRYRLLCWAGALLAMIAALGFKQIAIVIPALLVVVDFAFAPKVRIKDKLPFVLLAVAVLPLYFAIGARNQVIVPPPGGTRFTGFLTMTWVYAEYLGKLVAPSYLSARYVVRPILTVTDGRFLSSVALIVLVWLIAILVRHRTRVPLFVLLWITVSLLPVMNIIPIPIEMADRYLYLPSVGFVIGVGAGIVALMRRVGPAGPALARGIAGATFVLGAMWGAKSVYVNKVWQNDITLWSSVIARSPEFYIGRTHLGAAYLRRGDVVSAERELRASIATYPGDASAHLNLGMIYRDQKRYAEAREHFERAIALKPLKLAYAKAYNNLAAVAMDEGKWEEARPSLEQALAVNPDYGNAHRNFAIVCMQLHDPACAIGHMRSAVDAQPADREMFLDWLALLSDAGQAALALEFRDRIERRFPNDAEIWDRYARLLTRGGLPEAGEAQARATSLRSRSRK